MGLFFNKIKYLENSLGGDARLRGRSPSAVALVSLLLLGLGAASAPVQAAIPWLSGSEPSLAPMLKQVTPAVVNIATEGRVRQQNPLGPLFDDPFFRRFFDVPDMPREQKTQSTGSGVIVDAQRGLVITNNHVVANSDRITVTLRDGRHLSAKLVGTDPETDVAVLKIPAENLTALKIANVDQLQVGDFVVAIGNPFGLGQTVTSGIISALGRSGLGIEGYENFIQTDASINPGNSGGALVNMRGELIGINTAIFSQSGGNIGIGFAIPIDMASKVMDQLTEHGSIKRGYVGAQLQDLTPDLAKAFTISESSGAVIVSVVQGSPAAEADLKQGDVVVALDGKPVSGAASVRNRVGLMRIGDKVDLDVVRNGKHQHITVSIAQRQAGRGGEGGLNPRLEGASFGEIPRNHPAFGEADGVFVETVDRGSRAWTGGLRPSDIIMSVNQMGIQGLGEFKRAIQGGDRLLLQVLRGDAVSFIVLK